MDKAIIHIPMAQQARILLGSWKVIIPLLFVLIGIPLNLLLLPQIDYDIMPWKNAITTKGIVQKIEDTQYGENDRDIMLVAYHFYTEGGEKRQGMSYYLGDNLKIGDTVEVIYRKDAPSSAKLKKGREKPFSLLALIVLLFPLLGFGAFIKALVSGYRRLRIFKGGQKTNALLIDIQYADEKDDGDDVFNVLYEYKVEGKAYQIATKTTNPDKYKHTPTKVVYYNAQNPQDAFLEDEL